MVRPRVIEAKDLVFKDGKYTAKKVGAGIPSGDCRARTAGPITPTPSPYKSKWEAAYAQHLDVLKAAKEILGWWYEPIRFRLPGPRNFYKPDFLVKRWEQEYGHDWLEVHEVKGKWIKNRREGITKFKTAAGLNPWASFYLITREGSEWKQTQA